MIPFRAKLRAWHLTAVVAVAAVVCAALRVDSAPDAGKAIIGACIVAAAGLRYSEAHARRAARGLTTTRLQKAFLALSSAAVAIAIIMLADVVFLSSYEAFMHLRFWLESRSHYHPQYGVGNIIMASVAGGFLALRVANLVSRIGRPREPAADQETHRIHEHWPVALAIGLSYLYISEHYGDRLLEILVGLMGRI